MKHFTKLLRIRNTLKTLQQISWTISKMEHRYNVDEVGEDEAKEIITSYLDYIPKIKRILDELQDEKQNSTT